MIEGDTLYEFKAYSPFRASVALGHGSARCGGAPSTADGHFVAFGGTEEDLVKTVLGLPQRGLPTEPALDRTTGVGYVAPHKGDYADALSKRFTVVLFNMETSGAVGWRGVRLLRALARKAKRPGHRDGTVYGTARSATSSFFTHHLSAIAAAVALADALARSRPLPRPTPTRRRSHATPPPCSHASPKLASRATRHLRVG